MKIIACLELFNAIRHTCKGALQELCSHSIRTFCSFKTSILNIYFLSFIPVAFSYTFKFYFILRYDKVILIVRNPWDAILSFFHYVTQKSHTNTANRPIIKGQFDQFAEKRLSKWLEFNLKWLAHYSVFQSFLQMLRCYFSTNSIVKPSFKYRDGRLRGAFSDAKLIRLIMIIKLTVLILSQSSALIILEDGKMSNFLLAF